MPETTPVTIVLRKGDLKLALAPSVGGAIAGFWADGLALLRETPEQALRERLVRQSSGYPLIPYSNRIAQGRFRFDGVDHRLALNFGDHPHSVHGNAWQRPWRVEDADEARCRLAFVHRPSGEEAMGWPFAYRAEQVFEVSADGFTVALSLENQDGRPMPAGLGLHPFFPKRPGVRLQFAADEVFLNGDDALPVRAVPVPAEWDYRSLRDLGDPGLDNCFSGFSGKAEILFEPEGTALRIDADPVFGHVVVYVPSGRDFFAVEPVSHVNNAINRPDIPDNGLKVLQPGERLAGRIRFGVEAVR